MVLARTMWILLLIPSLLLALPQLLALVAFAQATPSTGVDAAALGVPLLAYIAAALLSLGAVGLTAVPARVTEPGPPGPLLALAALSGVLICAAPLLWGSTTGEFHLSHHLVRAAIVAGCLVLCSFYVIAHR
ncbi:MAG TPA: hypothetical protein VF289_13640 [Brachybacterium sp.]